MIKTVIGIDPGKNIGIARIDAEDGKILHQFDRVVSWDIFCVVLGEIETMVSMRKDEEPVTFVYEGFRLFAQKAGNQIGSNMPASEVIGAIKYAGARSNHRIKLVEQPASINKTAALWSGRGVSIVNKGGHLPDNISAYNHAHYYLVQNNFIRHRVLDD